MGGRLIAAVAAGVVVIAGVVVGTAVLSYNRGVEYADSIPAPTVTATATATGSVERTQFVTITASAAPVALDPASSASPADAAACRQIERAIDGSGLQPLADEQASGGSPFYQDVVTAGRRFAETIGTAPTAASDSITGPLGALVVILGILDNQYKAMPADVDQGQITTAMEAFPKTLSALEAACGS